MQGLLRNAEQILETAVAANGDEMQDCTISISRTGSIRVLSDSTGWSLSALAAEQGAISLFRIERRGATVRVEGWSPTDSCVLKRDLSTRLRPPVQATYQSYAVLPTPYWGGVSKNDFSPQVRNS